jgi:phytoene synthase
MQPRSPEHGGAGLQADLAECAVLLRQGSRTFHAASRLLPRDVRAAAIALYAFCRLADDAVDGGGQLFALSRLRQRLAAAYAGRPEDSAADRAFAWVVTTHGIPMSLPLALLEGFEWDARGLRYETLSDLRAYAARVAGAVGAMMSVLMGARRPEVLARACDLGIAMQLTNIARDVGEDARFGRLYLPLEWLREAGVDPDGWLARPVFTPAIASLTARLLDEADLIYARASAGIAHLPLACRPGMHAARRLYAEIGCEVRRRGYDAVSQRAVVSAVRKAALLPVAALATLQPAATGMPPALEEARFLVEAAAGVPDDAPLRGWRRAEERVLWVLDLFERLERRERMAASRASG